MSLPELKKPFSMSQGENQTLSTGNEDEANGANETLHDYEYYYVSVHGINFSCFLLHKTHSSDAFARGKVMPCGS